MVTLSDSNGNGMFLTIHHLNIAAVCTSWFLRNVLTDRRKKPHVDGLKIVEVRITGYSFCVDCDSVYVATKQIAGHLVVVFEQAYQCCVI